LPSMRQPIEHAKQDTTQPARTAAASTTAGRRHAPCGWS
jgi:hypothetical protein